MSLTTKDQLPADGLANGQVTPPEGPVAKDAIHEMDNPHLARTIKDVLARVLAGVTSRTRLAVLDHVTSATALVFPIEELVAELAARGVDTLVDGAHAPGMVPVDVDALGAAYWTGNGHKWLCGPKGTGMLWVRADRRERIHPLVVSHGANAELAGRSMLVRKLEMLPVECVARGYLAGSGWKEYRERGTVCGIALPPGLAESSRLPEPIFTPATKAQTGHDENISFERMCEIVGVELSEKLRDLSLEIYRKGAEYALTQGIIIADTKFEFGKVGDELILIDEVLTPDSSRFWPQDQYAAGKGQPSFDKQFVRDWLDASGWDREPPPPELPPEVVERTTQTYREAYERITGERFAWFTQRMGVLDEGDWETCAVNLDRLGEAHR